MYYIHANLSSHSPFGKHSWFSSEKFEWCLYKLLCTCLLLWICVFNILEYVLYWGLLNNKVIVFVPFFRTGKALYLCSLMMMMMMMMKWLLLLFDFFWDRVSLYNFPCCPRNDSINQLALKLTEITVSLHHRAGIKGMCHHHHALHNF